ncbi:MAG: hypothetical protein VYD76_09315, partial [Pseudomonadota bacterium]|nr:hypothetical protein [Pseudomonadota bacterium]
WRIGCIRATISCKEMVAFLFIYAEGEKLKGKRKGEFYSAFMLYHGWIMIHRPDHTRWTDSGVTCISRVPPVRIARP